MVPSFKNTALIFLEKLLIQHFTSFNCKQYDIITDPICIIDVNISQTKKDISKTKTPFSCRLKGLLYDLYMAVVFCGDLDYK